MIQRFLHRVQLRSPIVTTDRIRSANLCIARPEDAVQQATWPIRLRTDSTFPSMRPV
jgi:hypothetical protein